MKKKYEFIDSMHQEYEDYFGYVYITIDQKYNLGYVGHKFHKTYDSPNYFGSGFHINRIEETRGTFFLKKIILGVCYTEEELIDCETECKHFFNVLNPLYGYNIITEDNKRNNDTCYMIWIRKYGREEADRRLKEKSEKQGKSISGKNNGMFGTHGYYEKWVIKYGELEANRRYIETIDILKLCLVKVMKRKKK